jgi:CopG-like RHH_1 or ribbon-helix-helix domain, RHH_5
LLTLGLDATLSGARRRSMATPATANGIDPVTRRRLVAEAAAQRRTVSNLAKLLLEDALSQAGQVER